LTVTPVIPLVVISAPYPNPSRGTAPVTVEVKTPGTALVRWSVFTTAFRKIREGATVVTGIGTVTWDLKDKEGASAALGLYYLRVEVKGDAAMTRKVLKILIRP
jgi:hypothetical protein